jgi:group I intron endonuclease
MAIIYKATNKINGKAYIGYTKHWPLRKDVHESRSRSLKGEYFHNALAKHGTDNFIWEILLTEATLQDEINLIEEHGTYWETGQGYNLTKGGEGKVGYKTSAETKRKISESHKGKQISDLQRSILRLNAHRMKVDGHTPEAKAKISARHKGVPKTEEHKQNISKNHAAHKESGAFYQSPEFKAKISKALTGQKRTPEQRERYRLAAIERHKSPEYKKKIADAKAAKRNHKINDTAIL